MSRLPPHAETNRAVWNQESDAYEARNRDALSGAQAAAWGLFRRPERELKVLGEVAGLDVLELGCGAARWSIALAKAGARAVGLDLSSRQLDHAREEVARAGVSVQLVEASAEEVPLPDASFDVVFCDFGAMTFADPLRTVPEVARLLRPGGLLVFSNHSPIASLVMTEGTLAYSERLQRDYFSLRKLVDATDGLTEFHLPYGEWIALFGANGLQVEDLLELQAPEGATTPYRTEAEVAWARRWPMEVIWRVRKPDPLRPVSRTVPR